MMRTSLSRRFFLRGLGGAAVLAGTGGMAGCSSITGYNVENALVVEDAGENVFRVRPRNEEAYGGEVEGIDGRFLPTNENPQLWTPGVHRSTGNVPLAFTDEVIEKDHYVTLKDTVQDSSKESGRRLEIVYDGVLKEDWYQSYWEGEDMNGRAALYLGAIPAEELSGQDALIHDLEIGLDGTDEIDPYYDSEPYQLASVAWGDGL